MAVLEKWEEEEKEEEERRTGTKTVHAGGRGKGARARTLLGSHARTSSAPILAASALHSTGARSHIPFGIAPRPPPPPRSPSALPSPFHASSHAFRASSIRVDDSDDSPGRASMSRASPASSAESKMQMEQSEGGRRGGVASTARDFSGSVSESHSSPPPCRSRIPNRNTTAASERRSGRGTATLTHILRAAHHSSPPSSFPPPPVSSPPPSSAR